MTASPVRRNHHGCGPGNREVWSKICCDGSMSLRFVRISTLFLWILLWILSAFSSCFRLSLDLIGGCDDQKIPTYFLTPDERNQWILLSLPWSMQFLVYWFWFVLGFFFGSSADGFYENTGFCAVDVMISFHRNSSVDQKFRLQLSDHLQNLVLFLRLLIFFDPNNDKKKCCDLCTISRCSGYWNRKEAW